MKKLQILIVLICLTFSAIAQSPKEAIRIIRIGMGGNFVAYTIVGSDNNSLKRMVPSNPAYQAADRAKFIIKQSAIKYITKYILEHCDTINRRTDTTTDLFIISVKSSKVSHVCFIVDKNNSKPYFIGLKEWIERSPYKNDCKKFLARLEPYIR